MRDNFWLEEKLRKIWAAYFSDIPRLNNVNIAFGRKAKRRLASIRQRQRDCKNADTEIMMTGFYRDLSVPEFVVDVTIAHELCHYAHGFASPLPQFSKFPHRGDLVDKEIEKRGLAKDLKAQKEWLEKNWNQIVGEKIFGGGTRMRRRRNKSGKSAGFWVKFVRNLT